MRTSLKWMMLAGALLLTAVAVSPVALGAEACPNEQLRIEDSSTALPDCRAYELVSPDSNHAYIDESGSLAASADGNAMLYATADAPANASAGIAAVNPVLSKRDPASGWRGVGLAPPLYGPTVSYQPFALVLGVSPDFSTTLAFSTQPLDGEPRQAGFKIYRGAPGGQYQALTPIPGALNGGSVAGNADFTHVYFASMPQFPSDPLTGGNTYSWSQSKGLELLGILPDGTPAPAGANLLGSIIGPTSADASRALFLSEEQLYLHTDGAPSVHIGGPIHVDPTQSDQTISDRGGITADGSTVVFTSRAELTPDANTGIANAGRDLYRYDTHTGQLTDLTVDSDPADAATGAGVGVVVGASVDGENVYFTALGDLAAGAAAGNASLYHSHAGHVEFLASAAGISPTQAHYFTTPDGRHLAFESSQSLTGYDNTDPTSAQPHVEVFETAIGAGIVCVSCRPDGNRPTADSFVKAISDDGRRVFFGSTDAVIPQASSGLRQVFEYADGGVTAISPLNGSSDSDLLAISPSGDDAFIKTSNNVLPNPSSGPSAVLDARVGGGFPIPSRHECSGASCREPLSSAPLLEMPTSSLLTASGNPVASAPAIAAKRKALTRAQKRVRALRACRSKHDRKKRLACEKHARRVFGRTK